MNYDGINTVHCAVDFVSVCGLSEKFHGILSADENACLGLEKLQTYINTEAAASACQCHQLPSTSIFRHRFSDNVHLPSEHCLSIC